MHVHPPSASVQALFRFTTVRFPRRTFPNCPRQDIFSLGCVIAEVFCDGKALFDLSQLLAYRR